MSEVYPELGSLEEEYSMPINQVSIQRPCDVLPDWTACGHYHRDGAFLPRGGGSSLESQSALLGRLKGSTAGAERYIRCLGDSQPVFQSSTTRLSQFFANSAVEPLVSDFVKPLYPTVEISQKRDY